MTFTRFQKEIAANPNRVIIFDTTLRDGEQAAAKTLNREEKIQIAMALDAMGVDVIEAGFPETEGDFAVVQAIANCVENASVAGLCRATENSIQRAAEALAPANFPRIHTFIGTSEIHMRDKLKKTPQQVLDMIHDSVTLATSLVEDVEWSAEDAGRADIDFLTRCVQTAIDAGASTINLPDTVGYRTFTEIQEMFENVRAGCRNTEHVIFSTHCHNDLGNATANSMAALQGGARQIECTVNGIGERAGNTSLEQVVMNMRVRPDIYPYEAHVNSQHFKAMSEMVAGMTAMPVALTAPIVGEHVLRHASGIHQHGVGLSAATYEIFKGEDVGASTRIAITKHSGFWAVKDRLQRIGIAVADDDKAEVMAAIAEITQESGREVSDHELLRVFGDFGRPIETRRRMNCG